MDLKGLLKTSKVIVGGIEYDATELPIAAYAELSESPKMAAAIVWKWALGCDESAEEIAQAVPPRLLSELQEQMVVTGLASEPEEDPVKNSESAQTDSSSSD